MTLESITEIILFVSGAIIIIIGAITIAVVIMIKSASDNIIKIMNNLKGRK
jgi:energy-converting hydrogenase Eha subunit E